jgi:hypothetical protein
MPLARQHTPWRAACSAPAFHGLPIYPARDPSAQDAADGRNIQGQCNEAEFCADSLAHQESVRRAHGEPGPGTCNGAQNGRILGAEFRGGARSLQRTKRKMIVSSPFTGTCQGQLLRRRVLAAGAKLTSGHRAGRARSGQC